MLMISLDHHLKRFLSLSFGKSSSAADTRNRCGVGNIVVVLGFGGICDGWLSDI